MPKRTAQTKADAAQRERDARLREWERWLTEIDANIMSPAFRRLLGKKDK